MRTDISVALSGPHAVWKKLVRGGHVKKKTKKKTRAHLPSIDYSSVTTNWFKIS